MKKGKSRFVNDNAFVEMSDMLENWKDDSRKIKTAFVNIKDALLNRDNTILDFKSRPGVSYSLRANFKNLDDRQRALFALVDVIDDDPENRWLSVCFYVETITDPEEVGNLVPQGILGEDGYCFDLIEFEPSMISYIEGRIDEAYSYG